MTADAPLALAPLDQPPPATLDPGVWTTNLAALESVNAELAARVRTAAPAADCFRPARAVDGSVTFQESQDGAWVWWSATAAPAARAAGLFPAQPEQRGDVLLCDIGAGADLAAVLRAYPQHVRIFVAARRWVDIAAAFQLYDFAADVEKRRCWLLPPTQECAALAALPTNVPPPITLLRVPFGDDAKFEQLQAACVAAWQARSAV